MRVLHVIPAVAPRYGGPSRAVLAMCRALNLHGVATLVASTDADGSGRLPVSCGEEVDYLGVRSIFFRRQWSESFKYSRPLAAWLARAVREFDLVHIHAVFSHACLSAARSCRAAAIPYVLRPLGNLAPWSLSQHARRKRLFLALGGRTMIERAASLHATSEGEARDMRAFAGGRTFVAPLGVDEEWLESPPAPAVSPVPPPYVLFLGRLHPKKGVDLLIDAFEAVTREPRFVRWRLVLAGDGDPSDVRRLRTLAARAKAKIEFPGWLEGAERREALSSAAVVALLSRHENFGLAAAEAMARGVPVIVSRGVDLAGDVEESRAGWVAESLEPNDLELTLRAALEDGGERKLRGGNGRALVMAKFRWESVAAGLRENYDAILRGARSPGIAAEAGVA